MIDTVRLKVFPLQDHEVEQLQYHVQRSGVKGSRRKVREVPLDAYNKPTHLLQETIEYGSGKTYQIALRFYLETVLGYKVRCDFKADVRELTIEFSLPSLLYGHNVLDLWRMDQIYTNDVTKRREDAMQFLKLGVKYLWKLLFEADVDYSRTFIDRIDICGNKVFNSREEALACLQVMKKHIPKGDNKKGKGVVEYPYGLFKMLRGGSNKIYHKGEDFRQNDKAGKYDHLSKKDKIVLQAFADKVLRYEVMLRRPLLNYQMWRKYFPTVGWRKHCKNAKLYSKYKGTRLYHLDDGFFTVSDKGKRIGNETAQKLTDLWSIMNKTLYYPLAGKNWRNVLRNCEFGDLEDFSPFVKFDVDLLNIGVRRFKQWSDDYRLTDVEPIHYFEKYCKENGHTFTRWAPLFKLMNDGMDLTAIRKNGLVSDSKYFLFKKVLNDYNGAAIVSPFPDPDFNELDYYGDFRKLLSTEPMRYVNSFWT